ncbi:unnamed protein product [Pedinophyceae sp. YPF-701]|nr:unnamed protein product [Pedinophyceae sp. YPF-701]
MGAEATLEAQMREFGLEEQDGKTKGYGGFRWDSPEQLAAVKAHRKLAWDWATSMGLSVFKQGLNLTKVSMPVAFFEDRSFLERMAENWAYLDLLKAAAREKDPVERMRCVVAFAIAGLVRQCSHGKPFNPLLGETLQAELDGVQLFAEQISHHPPISSWQMFDKDGLFRFQGHGEWRAKTYANSVEGVQKGVNRVTFKVDGSSIEWELPGMTLYGIIMGDRYMKYQGTMTFRDQQNGLQADIEIDPPREGGLLGAASRWWSGARLAPKQAPLRPAAASGGRPLTG